MDKVSLPQGWVLFVKALFSADSWKLEQAAEWMFRLNAYAREIGRMDMTDQIYTLKNALIKYLYQNGYAKEVKMHYQKRICNNCDGTGEHWTGDVCYRCGGTGIYSTTWLYAFRFEINGHRFAWHQLQKLVDYPVELTTNGNPGEYQGGQGSGGIQNNHEAWFGCCVVWWSLWLHGVSAELALFPAARNWTKKHLQRWLPKRKDKPLDIPF